MDSSVLFLFFTDYSVEDTTDFLFDSICGEYECIRIDARYINAIHDLKLIKSRNKKTIFITSLHLITHAHNISACELAGQYRLSVLEAIAALEPVFCVYYPHDLSNPVLEREIPYLNNIFDLLLMPHDKLPICNSDIHIETEYVGWSKYLPNKKTTPLKKVFFVGATSYYLHHIDEFFEKFEPLFKTGVAIKIHDWPGTEVLKESILRKKYFLYNDREISVDIILANDIIFATGQSSIVMEAYLLGKKVFYIWDDKIESIQLACSKEKFKDLNKMVYLNCSDLSLMLPTIDSEHIQLKQFDITKSLSSIMSHLKRKTNIQD